MVNQIVRILDTLTMSSLMLGHRRPIVTTDRNENDGCCNGGGRQLGDKTVHGIASPVHHVTCESNKTNTAVSTSKKIVRFKRDLETIKLFCKSDHPRALNQQSYNGQLFDATIEDAGTPFVQLQNTPSILKCLRSLQTGQFPVHLKEVRLCSHPLVLDGLVAVQNLAFQKTITCRFSLDNWTTMSDVPAEYVYQVHGEKSEKDEDVFQFLIPIADYGIVGKNTLLFCIRYLANDQEFWDNNSSNNFAITFKITHQAQKGAQMRMNGQLEGANNDHSRDIDTLSPKIDLQRFSEVSMSSDSTHDVTASANFPNQNHTNSLRIGTLARRYNFSAALAAVQWPNDDQGIRHPSSSNKGKSENMTRRLILQNSL